MPERAVRKHGGEDSVPRMPFVPHFLLRDMVGWYLALGLLAALAALFPWELGQKADPFGSAPAGIKPEWYFLFMFQTLKQLPGTPLRDRVAGRGHGRACCSSASAAWWCCWFRMLDFGASRGRSRRVLNVLAAAAVVFFICHDRLGAPMKRVAVVESDSRRSFAPIRLRRWRCCLQLASAATAAEPKAARPASRSPGPNNCILCHGNKDVWEGEQLKLYVTEADLAGDIHWQSGLRCQDCHGGNPRTDEVRRRTPPKTASARWRRPRTFPSSAASATPTSSTCAATAPRRGPTSWPSTGPAATASSSRRPAT